MTRSRQTFLSVAGFTLLVLVWAYNWVVTKNTLHFIGPFALGATRTLTGAATLFMLLWQLKRPLRPQAIAMTIWLGLLQTGLFLILMNSALIRGGAGRVSVLSYSMPFWTLLLAWPLLGERVRGAQWLAIGLAVAGMVLILQPWQMAGSTVSKVLAIVSGISWAGGNIVAKLLKRAHPDVDVLSLTAWQMLFGAIPVLILALVVPERQVVFAPYLIFGLLFSGVLASGFGYLLWMMVLQRLSAGTASLSTLAVPVVAVLAAWWEQGERPDAVDLAGMVAIALALASLSAIALYRQRKPK